MSFMQFHENSCFLANSECIQQYVEKYIFSIKNKTLEKFFIVCERKEDIKTVREQIILEVQKVFPSISSIYGISMYTLDSLGAKISSVLSELGFENEVKNISKPYLDIVAIEECIELLLLKFGYKHSDSLSVAKQISVLLNVVFPVDQPLFDWFNLTKTEKNSLKHQKKVQMQDENLKIILAVYQSMKIILTSFATFSNLTSFFKDIKVQLNSNHKELFNSIFCGNLLWFSAPEVKNTLLQFQKPGNYQNYLVEDFKTEFFELRNFINDNLANTFERKTIWGEIEPETVAAFVYHSPRDSWNSFQESLGKFKNEHNHYFCLADFSFSEARILNSKALGKKIVDDNLYM
jgi:hypothetical protein